MCLLAAPRIHSFADAGMHRVFPKWYTKLDQFANWERVFKILQLAESLEKFAIKLSFQVGPHQKYVDTLPCEFLTTFTFTLSTGVVKAYTVNGRGRKQHADYACLCTRGVHRCRPAVQHDVHSPV